MRVARERAWPPTSPPPGRRSAAAPLSLSSPFSRPSVKREEEDDGRKKKEKKKKRIPDRIYFILDGNLWYFEDWIIRLPISDLFALEQGNLYAPSLSLSMLLHGKKERRKMTAGRRRKKRKRKRKRKTDRVYYILDGNLSVGMNLRGRPANLSLVMREGGRKLPSSGTELRVMASTKVVWREASVCGEMRQESGES
uniref:Uncharacterized protein n=1 Tax=Oryza rufipogon TaxID=4529 RepID=A0A0E0Q6C0_ORYRU